MGGQRGASTPSQRRLVLLRHAKSSWKHDLPDEERPLSGRGRRDALEAGRWIAAHVGRPDLVLCSTAVRTRQTWAQACEAQPHVLGPVPVRFEAAIYQASSDTLLRLVRQLPTEVLTAVLVGHATGVPDLAEGLHGPGHGPVGDFPTSAVAAFTLTGAWTDLGTATATLKSYAVPRG